ncbi:ribonuclease BN [Hymenobacter sedentarius]|uniref:Ribonuclease BN n=1 Tax=Hymenobacter sedentarius TaxID=1411621 RepID=A0A0U4AFB0_9BACT|nr:YihY/virulence factor BrkB family protein [Hymenobacter sedentarius]ALW86908.1 ribonuclease BN [Hymenobacter sedentarius]
MNQLTAKGIWEVFKQTGAGFSHDKVPKLSAALAYYAIFSLGPMLMVIIFTSELLWQQQAVEGKLFGQIQALVGAKAALQVQDIIRSAAFDGNNKLNALIGFVTLTIAATGLFTEMQDSINTIWQLKIKPNAGWRQVLQSRATSFLLIVSLGFLLIVSLIITGLVEGLMGRLKEIFPDTTVILVYVANLLLTLLITSALFAIIYKVLPDAIIRWKDVAVGAVFTALLFMLGKFGITLYLKNSNVGTAYGTAGSLVVLLLWIYYSTIILYFGAEFTKCYVIKYGTEIQPNKQAVLVQTVQVESKEMSVRENEENRENLERELQRTKDDLDRKRMGRSR